MDDPARDQILRTKPQRKAYESEEAYEEALSYWMSRQGRSPVLRKGSSPQPSRSEGGDSAAPGVAPPDVAGSADQHEDSRNSSGAPKLHESLDDVQRPVGWESNPVVAALLSRGLSPTAESYKAMAFPDYDPDDLPAEFQAEVERLFPEEYESRD